MADQDSGAAVKRDIGTELAYERTELAVQRSFLAAERTLMAWIRTSLSMISFGFTIGKLKDILGVATTTGVLGVTRSVSTQRIAVFLVILGTLTLIGAAWQHVGRLRELRELGLKRQVNMTLIVASLLAAIGAFALVALVLSF